MADASSLLMPRPWHTLTVVLCCAAASLAVSLLRPAPALACGCSSLGTQLVAPANGAVAANGGFLVWNRRWITAPSLSDASGASVPLVEAVAHGHSLCSTLALMRPAEPLVAGKSYSLALDFSKTSPVTALPATTPATQAPRFSVSVIERPAQSIEGGGCGAPEVTEWYEIDVAPNGPGELHVFAWVPHPEYSGVFNG
jgi:hypothetical protein